MRHVLVTGAGSGIGRATAEAFVRAGDVVVAGVRDPARSGEVEAARQVFETNYWGAVRVVRAVLAPMRERRSGTFINVSTVGGRTAS